MEHKGSMSDDNLLDDLDETPPASPSRHSQKPMFGGGGGSGNNAASGAGGNGSAQVLSASFSRLSSSGSKAGALEALLQEDGRPDTIKSLPTFPQPTNAAAHDHDDSPSYYRSPRLDDDDDDAPKERRASPEELHVEEDDDEEEQEEEEEEEGEPQLLVRQATGGSRRIIMLGTDEGTIARMLRGDGVGLLDTDEGSVAQALRDAEPSPHRASAPSPHYSTLDSLPPQNSPAFVPAPLLASLPASAMEGLAAPLSKPPQGGVQVASGGGRSPRWSVQPIDTSQPHAGGASTDPPSPPPIPLPISAPCPMPSMSPRTRARSSLGSTATSLPVVPEEHEDQPPRHSAPPRSRRRGPEEHMDTGMEQRVEQFLAYTPQPSTPSPRPGNPSSSPRPRAADAALARSSAHTQSRHPKEQQAPHATQSHSAPPRRQRSSSVDSDNRRPHADKPHHRTRRSTLAGSPREGEQEVVYKRLYALRRTEPARDEQSPTREHTFHPKLETQHYFKSHNFAGQATPFAERLYDMQGWLSHVKKMEEKRKSLEVAGCTFSPDVARTASPARGGDPTWKRLYEKQPLWEQARAVTRQQLADAEMAKCTFTPELATRSKSPQKQKDEPATKPKGRCHERLYGEALKRFDRMDTKAKAPLADCTFTPSIGTRPGGKDASYRASGRVRATELYLMGHERVTKLRLIEEAKKPPKPDDSDETHCTFFPVTNWAKRVQRGDARRAVLGDATCW